MKNIVIILFFFLLQPIPVLANISYDEFGPIVGTVKLKTPGQLSILDHSKDKLGRYVVYEGYKVGPLSQPILLDTITGRSWIFMLGPGSHWWKEVNMYSSVEVE